MNPNTRNPFAPYEHEGKPFTKQVAIELIFKAYVGQTPVDERRLPEDIYQIHERHGGLHPDVTPTPRFPNISKLISRRVRWHVRSALDELKRNGGATYEGRFLWRIHEEDIDAAIRADEQTYPKVIATGKQEVYLYYYPAYRKLAARERPPVWKERREDALWRCKIGETHAQGTKTRTGQQGRVLPEKKVIALILKTDDSKQLEKMIKDILKFWGRKVPDADVEGTEWYRTSPAEVETIHDFLRYGL